METCVDRVVRLLHFLQANIVNSIFSAIDGFFFRKISASGFGLMRIVWAACILFMMLGSGADTVRYYSNSGIIPRSIWHLAFRSQYRFTVLDWITAPEPVVLLWTTFMLCLFFMMLGIHSRLMTVLSVLLLASFHERNLQIINAGDTLFQIMGWILMISPRVDAFSLDRLRHQYHTWMKKGKLLPPIRSSIWAYRLLLWQLIVLYLMSGWAKLHGHMWGAGTAIASTFHHTDYFRFPKIFADYLTIVSPFFSRFWLLYAPLWGLLLIPKSVWRFFPPFFRRHSLKRWLLIGGAFVHACIGFFMDVGAWGIVMQVGFIGVLLDEDFSAMRSFFNRRWKRRYSLAQAKKIGETISITVLYDGSCTFCRRSIFVLVMLDHLHRLTIVNFREPAIRKKYAPDISEKDLNRALHIRFPDRSTFSGFHAFRQLASNLPLLWIFVPILHLPLASYIGSKLYRRISSSRAMCSDNSCSHS